MSAEAQCRFFVPGPTWVRPEILRELTRPMIGHRSAEFQELFRRIATDLQPLFGTAGDTLVATCSGTGLMQAAGEIPATGVHTPDECVPAEKYLAELARRGVVVTSR